MGRVIFVISTRNISGTENATARMPGLSAKATCWVLLLRGGRLYDAQTAGMDVSGRVQAIVPTPLQIF
jgi:hypothetical protein